MLPTLLFIDTMHGLHMHPAIVVSPPLQAKPAAYGTVEFAVSTDGVFHNPFDPAEVDIEGVFSQKGKRITIPAFWDGKQFRLRFCPTKPGTWRLDAVLRTPGRQSAAREIRFTVGPSKEEGFVRVSASNPRYLCFDTNRSFVPIGLNLCWPDDRGLASYDARFAKLRSVGGNFARIWTTQERRLETKEAGLGFYDLNSAAYYDSIFVLASAHGIRTMLTLDDYRVLTATDYFNAHWAESPYNSANGGPLRNPTDFFLNSECRRLYKQRLRYLVARYGAYTSLAFWELYNEQDNIPEPGVPTEWFREMTSYLASIDPYHHLITTSYSWRDKPEVWESPALALTQRHLYGQGDTVDFVSMIIENGRKLDRYQKPRLIGEFGITWKEPDISLDKAKLGTPLHDALWASILSGDAGGALTWWWDNYLEPLDLWHVYIGISRFIAGIDFANRHFAPIQLTVEGLTAIGLQDKASGESIVWLHDPASNWKSDVAGKPLTEWDSAKLVLPATQTTNIEFWDTRTGLVIGRLKASPTDGLLSVGVPAFRRDIALHFLAARPPSRD